MPLGTHCHMTASSLHNTYHTKSEFTIATHCNMTASSFDKIYDTKPVFTVKTYCNMTTSSFHKPYDTRPILTAYNSLPFGNKYFIQSAYCSFLSSTTLVSLFSFSGSFFIASKISDTPEILTFLLTLAS